MKEFKNLARTYTELFKIFLSFVPKTTRKLSIQFDIRTSAYVRHKITTSLSTFFLDIGISFYSEVYNMANNPLFRFLTAALVYVSF